jgi:hypothetical protein
MPLSQVYAAKVNGLDYNTVPPNVTGSGAGGNGGAATRVQDTNKFDGVGVDRYDAGVFGSTVIQDTVTVKDYAGKPYSAGTFSYNNQKPVAPRYTTQISGVSNTILQSAADVPSLVQSIHYMKVCGMGCDHGVRTRRFTSAIRANHYNRFTGQWDVGYPVVAADVFDTDNAAVPTRSVPGGLTFKYALPNPYTTSYKAKTG